MRTWLIIWTSRIWYLAFGAYNNLDGEFQARKALVGGEEIVEVNEQCVKKQATHTEKHAE